MPLSTPESSHKNSHKKCSHSASANIFGGRVIWPAQVTQPDSTDQFFPKCAQCMIRKNLKVWAPYLQALTMAHKTSGVGVFKASPARNRVEYGIISCFETKIWAHLSSFSRLFLHEHWPASQTDYMKKFETFKTLKSCSCMTCLHTVLLWLSFVLLHLVEKAGATALQGSKMLSAAELKKVFFFSPFKSSFRPLIWAVQVSWSMPVAFLDLRLHEYAFSRAGKTSYANQICLRLVIRYRTTLIFPSSKFKYAWRRIYNKC